MEEKMAAKDSLLGVIFDFITRRKVKSLETAFRNSPEIVDAVKKMDASYMKINTRLENYCKKNPDICKEFEERKNKFRS